MRISDWSSDVCSSDLLTDRCGERLGGHVQREDGRYLRVLSRRLAQGRAALRAGSEGRPDQLLAGVRRPDGTGDRQSVVWGKSVSVRVDLGGRRIIKKKKRNRHKRKRRNKGEKK